MTKRKIRKVRPPHVKLFAPPSVRTRRKLTDALFRPIAQRESNSKLPPAKPRMQAGGTQDHQHADQAAITLVT